MVAGEFGSDASNELIDDGLMANVAPRGFNTEKLQSGNSALKTRSSSGLRARIGEGAL